MSEYLHSSYGDRIADTYDALYPEHDAAAIELLADLALDGPALELGIGTGRLALPLAARGIRVHGIDASSAMVAKLRKKPGGDELPVTIANFGKFELGERFQLIYVAFNTIFALLTQDEQVDCFRSVAVHLKEGGCFLIEAFVPDTARFDRGQRVSAVKVESDALSLEVTRHEPTQQRVNSQLVRITEEGIRLFPVQLRYAWPSELDLMARLAGLELSERWATWERREFDARSEFHISVYRPG